MRGGNPLDLRDRCPQECTNENSGFPSSVFPTLQAVQGAEVTSRGPGGSRAEGDARNVLSTRRECHGRVRTVYRGCSSAGRAPALHAGGHRFESGHLHQNFVNRIVDSRSLSIAEAKDWIPLANNASLSRASATEEWMQAGQATKGPRWMPRHQAPKKDAATCEKRRGVGSKR